jgi:hypothetical protein
MDAPPRPYVRIDRVWFLDRKYRKVSHEAILLHFGLIGLTSHEGNDGRVRREDADLIADNIKLDPQAAWDELLKAGLLIPGDDDWFALPNYNRWQVLASDRSRAATNGSVGGRKSGAKREASSGGLPPTSTNNPSDDGDFDYNEGLNEALAAYPFTKYQDQRTKQEQAYRSQVCSQADHERIMLSIRNYSDYQTYVKKTEGAQKSAEATMAFSNFLKTERWQTFLTLKVPTDEQLTAPPTVASAPSVNPFGKQPKKKPETVSPGENIDEFRYLVDEETK